MLASRGSELQWRVGWNETQETESLILISIISVAEGTYLTLSRLWCLDINDHNCQVNPTEINEIKAGSRPSALGLYVMLALIQRQGDGQEQERGYKGWSRRETIKEGREETDK